MEQRFVVRAYLPYLKSYGRDPNVTLTYGYEGEPINVGDKVLCPSPPLGNDPFQGIVVSLDTDYQGPVKSIITVIERKK